MGICNAQTYSLNKGLHKFKDKGNVVAIKEIAQLHNQEVFIPISPGEITKQEKLKTMNSLIFIMERHEGKIKAHAYANSSIQCKYITKQEATSLTVTTERIL